MTLKNKKILISLVIIILFISNYYLCYIIVDLPINQEDRQLYKLNCLDYKDKVSLWWKWKANIYAIIISLSFWLTSIGQEKKLKFITIFGLGISISNIIDRMYYDITTFTKQDILMLLITFIITYIKVYGSDRIRKILN